jgi:hypothetical protein
MQPPKKMQPPKRIFFNDSYNRLHVKSNATLIFKYSYFIELVDLNGILAVTQFQDLGNYLCNAMRQANLVLFLIV